MNPKNFIIFQKPNPPLIIAATGFVVSKLTSGPIQQLARVVFTVAIIIWAYEEVTMGVNLFRKLLGAVVLLIVAISLFSQLQ